MRLWLSCSLLLALAGQPQPQLTIRTDTRVVQIDVDARDTHGRPVSGLTKDDFTILDSGKPRTIQIFTVQASSDTPTAAPPAVLLPPNVFSNQSPPRATASRATVILLDGINNYWDDFAAARSEERRVGK